MKTSELNPRERFGLFLIDERPDRIPIIPLITSHAAIVSGISVRDYCTNGKSMAKAHVEAYKRYGHDAVMLFSDVGMVAEAFGSTYSFPEDDIPTLETPVVTDLASVSNLSIANMETPGRWGVYFDAIGITYRQLADRVPILCFIPAPFTTAAGMRGTEDFLVDLMLDPELAHELLKKAEEGVIRLTDEVMLRGALPVLVDPLASGSVISSSQFKSFALPYLQNCVNYLHRFDMDVILHICGKTAGLWDGIPDSHADLFSLDDVSLHDACVTLGNKMRIIGNLRPADMLRWNPKQVEEAVREAVITAKDTIKGFALSTGCEVPLATKPENLDAMVMTARWEGRYW